MRVLAAMIVLAAAASLPSCRRGDEPAAGVGESAADPAPRPEPAAPSTPEAERTLYRIAARLDPSAHTVDGVEELSWVNRGSRPATEIVLYLHLDAFSREDTLFLREAHGALRGFEYRGPGRLELRALRVDGRDRLEASSRSETWITVPLEPPAAPGERRSIRAEFTAHLPPVFARTGWAGRFHLAAQWFPKMAVQAPDGSWLLRERHPNAEFLADHDDYDVTLDVPEPFVVGATGEEVQPLDAATESGFVRRRFVLRRGVDFAFTAWDRFRQTRETVEGVALRWLYPPEAERTLANQRAVLAAALPRLVSWFGVPPYPSLTVVLIPPEAEGAGGMEYPGLITTTADPAFPGYRDDQEVAVHELVHQWFYALVASDEAFEPWLDEGVTTYVTGLLLDEIFGDDRSMVAAGPLGIGYFASRRACWRAAGGRNAADAPAESYPTFEAYTANAYCRAALALRALETAAGRERVLGGLRRYVDRHRFARGTAAALRAALAESCGAAAVARVLRPALEASGGFELRLRDVEVRRAADDTELIAPRSSAGTRYLTRFTVARSGAPVEVPVEVEIRFPGGTVRRARWDGRGTSARMTVQSDRPPEAIALDPDTRVLLDENLLDNGWRSGPVPPADGVSDELLAGYAGFLAGWL